MSSSAQPDPISPHSGGAADSFFSTRGTTPSTDPIAALIEREGRSIGRYKLLQLIGEGGFGSVFLAEQSEPVRRRVALKIIKPGMDSKMVAARFEAERQALALMDHPHIARVFDGGVTDAALGSRPYFVMEYVIGDPITTFADTRKLSLGERLDLFTQVCDAVQHAHTKGVIHRDLKPGNILASMVDGRPFAKVIDFGIAKATGSALTDKTLFTEHRQLIGTPEYMSPEQAEGSPDIDTRTDVYALGVLLYELLTGATPFDGARLRSAAFVEMQRIIKEEDPPAPSVRLSRDLKALAATAAARQSEPARLGTLLKGDLDWIAMKAIDKDRARRYESPNQLGADIRRHLSGAAVLAAPPSAAYRVRKFVRKHRGAVLAAGVVTAALLVAIAGTTWALSAQVRAQRAEAAGREGREAVEWGAYKERILAAQSFVMVQKFAESGRRLEECKKEFRGWEWDLLSRYPSSGVVPLPRAMSARFDPRSEGVIVWTSKGWQASDFEGRTKDTPAWLIGRTLVHYSPDSRAVLTCADNVATIWDVNGDRRGEARLKFAPTTAAWSLSGEYVVVIRDSQAQVIDSRGRAVGQAMTSPGVLKSFGVANDGRTLLVGGDGVARVWDREGRSVLVTLRQQRPIAWAAFSPTGATIISPDSEGEVCLWDVTPNGKGKLVSVPGVAMARFSPDGELVAMIVRDGVQLWTSRGESVVPLLRHAGGAPSNVIFSPDGKRLLTTIGAEVCLWDVNGKRLGDAITASGTIETAKFSPDGTRVLTVSTVARGGYGEQNILIAKRIASWDIDSICRWSFDIPEPASAVPSSDFSTVVNDAEYSLDGSRLLLTVGASSSPRIFLVVPERASLPVRFVDDLNVELATEAAAQRPEKAFEPPRPLTLASSEGAVEVRDENGQVIGRLIGHIGEVRGLAVHPGGTRVATAGDDRTVRLWETSSWREVAAFSVPVAIESLAFSPSGSQLILTEQGHSTIWDARTTVERQRDAEVRATETGAARKLVEDELAGSRSLDEIKANLETGPGVSHLCRLLAARELDQKRAGIRQAAETLIDQRRAKYLTRANLARHRDRGDVEVRVWQSVVAAEAAWDPTPSALNELAWAEVKRPGAAADRLDAALEMVREAVHKGPKDWQITNTLGFALLRTGAWEEGIKAFELSDQQHAEVVAATSETPSTPVPSELTNTLGIAMCQWKLGRQDEARARLEELRKARQLHPVTSSGKDEDGLVHEAEELTGVEGLAPEKSP